MSEAPGTGTPGGYIPALDGLRAVAILAVVLHNSGVTAPPTSVPLKLFNLGANAGWAGVQLFFALSGFLITGILLNARGTPRALRNFYARRVLRIFPLYYVFLVCIIFLAPRLVHLPAALRVEPHSSWWYFSYLSNWREPFAPGVRGLSHLWSLAVEEQFYLLWPALALGLSPRRFLGVCVGLTIAAPLIRLGFYWGFPTETAGHAAYYLTVGRCDALALGGVAAVIARRTEWRARLRPWLAGITWATGGILVGAVLLLRGFDAYRSPVTTAGQSVLALFCTGLILLAILPSPYGSTTLKRILSLNWLRGIGKYSYAIYLFHLPVAHAVARLLPATSEGGPGTAPLGRILATPLLVFGLSFLPALSSWYLLEQPFLDLKRYFAPPAPRPAT